MSNKKFKLNKAGKSHSGHFTRPLELSVFGIERPTASMRLALCAVQSLSVGEKYCEFTYGTLAERYNLSIASAARSFKKINESEAFERGEKKRQYRFVGELPVKHNFFTVYDWLYHANFEIGNKTVYYTKVQVEVLCYILRNARQKRNYMTRRYIAKQLGIAPATVSKAVEILKLTGLVKIKEKAGYERSVNSSTRTYFEINEKLFAAKRKAALRYQQEKSEDVTASDSRPERERYYAQREALEQYRIDVMKEELSADEEYANADRALNVSEMEIGKAQARHDSGAVRRLLEARLKLQKQKRERLKLFGYTEEDFYPHFLCPACKDTGNRADGTFCDCWQRGSP